MLCTRVSLLKQYHRRQTKSVAMGHAIRSLLWYLCVPFPLAYVVPWALAAGDSQETSTPPVVGWLGLIAVALGSAGLLWCFVEFVRRGEGTPAPYEPPKRLVDRGLFRMSRNPMYLNVVVAALGQAAWWGSWVIAAYAAMLLLALHVLVVFHEEPSLRRRFEGDYDDYCAEVPRWLGRP